MSVYISHHTINILFRLEIKTRMNNFPLKGGSQLEMVLDSRERNLRRLMPEAAYTYLEIGDVVFRDCKQTERVYCVVERKTLSDLASSIIDQRYKKQASSLHKVTQSTDAKVVYIVEGTLPKLEFDLSLRSDMTSLVTNDLPENISSAISTLIFQYGFCVLRTLDTYETVKVLRKVLNKPKNLFCEKLPEFHQFKKKIQDDSLQKAILLQVRGVSTNLANTILDHCGGHLQNLNSVTKEVRTESGRRLNSRTLLNLHELHDVLYGTLSVRRNGR
jgi:ERCC4-type nuclease